MSAPDEQKLLAEVMVLLCRGDQNASVQMEFSQNAPHVSARLDSVEVTCSRSEQPEMARKV